MANVFQPVGKGTSDSGRWAQANKNFAQLDREAVTKVFKNILGNEGTVIGQLPNDLGTGFIMNSLDGVPLIYAAVDNDGQPILKVAKTGHDATSASDENLVFNSAQNVLKVIKTDTVNLPALGAAGSSGDTSTITVNTGVSSTKPYTYLAYMTNDSGGYIQLPFFALNYSGFFQETRSCDAAVSGGQVQLRIYSQNFTGFSTPARTLKYYLLSESIT